MVEKFRTILGQASQSLHPGRLQMVPTMAVSLLPLSD